MFSGMNLKQLRNIKQGAARVRAGMGVPAGQGLQVEKTALEQEQRRRECPVAHDDQKQGAHIG